MSYEFSIFDHLYSPLPTEPFLLILRENLNCFFSEDFTISYATLLRVLDDYSFIKNPDFFIELTYFNDIQIRFVERKDNEIL